jgi:hypothetical protein
MNDDFTVGALQPDALLESIYNEVLIPSFTSDELEPLDDLHRYLGSDPPEAFGLYAERRGRPLGCCIYYPYPVARTLLLGYMVVVDGYRSQGIGSGLLRESRLTWYGSDQYDLVLAELDDPRVFPATGGIDPERRIAFYSKHKARLICGPYFAPSVRPGGRRVHGMLLALIGGSAMPAQSSRPAVSADCLAAFLQEYFTVEQGLGKFDAGDLDWMIGTYQSVDSVPLIPLAEYRLWDAPMAPSRRPA